MSFWAGFQEKFPLAACCVFRLHPDMPQHVQRKSPCLQINLHKHNELCHHPLLWNYFQAYRHFPCLILSSEFLWKSQAGISASFSCMQNRKFDNLEALFKMDTHTYTPPKYQLCISPPKTQPVWFQVAGEMPRKALQQIPKDWCRREMASLDNSLFSKRKTHYNLRCLLENRPFSPKQSELWWTVILQHSKISQD